MSGGLDALTARTGAAPGGWRREGGKAAPVVVAAELSAPAPAAEGTSVDVPSAVAVQARPAEVADTDEGVVRITCYVTPEQQEWLVEQEYKSRRGRPRANRPRRVTTSAIIRGLLDQAMAAGTTRRRKP